MRAGLICVALLALLMLGLAPVLLSQPPAGEVSPEAAASVVAPEPGVGFYVGSASCGTPLCHGSVAPRDVYDIRQNEYHVWSTADPHFHAYEVLSDPRSLVMARNLGMARPPREAAECRACHAFAPPPERISGRLPVEEGIPCEGCHGPAGGWIGSHDEAGWSHADSVAAGMRDLQDPSTRAELCLSCHLGEAGKNVDHRLLAAGHPRLDFELDNFAASVSHWRDAPEVAGARAWAVGQVAALEAEMERIVRLAGAGAWPELSLMTCGDCHHSLAEERWRQEPSAPVTGLPRWSPERWATLSHLVAAFAPAEVVELSAALAEVARTVGRLGTPPAEAEGAAREVRRVAARVVRAVERAEWSDRQIYRVLLAIALDGEGLPSADPAAARQAAYAVNTLASALVARDPRILTTPLPDAVEAVYQAAADPYHYDRARFAAALARLADVVRRAR